MDFELLKTKKNNANVRPAHFSTGPSPRPGLLQAPLIQHYRAIGNQAALRLMEAETDRAQPPADSAPAVSATGDEAAGIARIIWEAVEGTGTDEEAIFAALEYGTSTTREQIEEAYLHLTEGEETLEEALIDDLSGLELTKARRLLEQGHLEPEDKIYLAIEGAGTDEELLFEALKEMKDLSAGEIETVMDRYEDKYHADMLEDIRDDLSGSDLDNAPILLHGLGRKWEPVGELKSLPEDVSEITFCTPIGEEQPEPCNETEKLTVLRATSTAVSAARFAYNELYKTTNNKSKGIPPDIRTHFENEFDPSGKGIKKGETLRGTLTAIKEVYRDTITELLSKRAILCIRTPPEGWYENNPKRHEFARTNVEDKKIYICPIFFKWATFLESDLEHYQARVMLHEHTHLVGIGDVAYRGQAEYQNLQPNPGPHNSLDNADSYAYFAFHLKGW